MAKLQPTHGEFNFGYVHIDINHLTGSQQDSCRRKNAEGQDVEERTARAQKTQLVPHHDEMSTDGSEAELEQEMG